MITPDDGLTECNGATCTARIRFVITEAGKRLPINPDPHPHGNIIRIRLADGSIRARVLSGAQLPAQQTAWRPHWATCPDAPEFQARRHRTAARCRACGDRLDPWLPAHGWAHHILCAPPTRAEIEAAMTRTKENP